jgi:hypothetical protein
MLSVAPDCPFLIVQSVFSNGYQNLTKLFTKRAYQLEADIVNIPTADHNYSGINNMYNQTCIKMSP